MLYKVGTHPNLFVGVADLLPFAVGAAVGTVSLRIQAVSGVCLCYTLGLFGFAAFQLGGLGLCGRLRFGLVLVVLQNADLFLFGQVDVR